MKFSLVILQVLLVLIGPEIAAPVFAQAPKSLILSRETAVVFNNFIYEECESNEQTLTAEIRSQSEQSRAVAQPSDPPRSSSHGADRRHVLSAPLVPTP